MNRWPRFRMAGDSCVVVELGDKINKSINKKVQVVSGRVRSLPGVTAVVPTYRSVVVHYDPLVTNHRELLDRIKSRLVSGVKAGDTGGQVVEIPTCYGEELGPDLDYVAHHHGMTVKQVVDLHSKNLYHVYMLGFLPGFPYLGGLPRRLATPRAKNPRPSVPAGSVGIGGGQTGIYPVESPGGWHIIGRTPVNLYDPGREPPVLLKAGDKLKFIPIGRSDYYRLLPERTDTGEHPVFEVINPGLLTTVQDLGRYGRQQYGIPVAGAADRYSYKAANLLVGNRETAAALEITVFGPRLKTLADTIIAVTGADLGARLNGRPLTLHQAVPVKSGSIIDFSVPLHGCRAYLAVAGGIAVPLVMGSRSTSLRARLGGYRGRALESGDLLSAYRQAGSPPNTPAGAAQAAHAPVPRWEKPCVIRVIPGPRDDYFTARGKETFFSSEYTVGMHSDRMGLRLEGPLIEHSGATDIISDGTVPGIIQVPGDGRPVILFVDAQTVGGYPEIATVITADLPKLAQLLPGDRLMFVPVTIEEACRLLREERDMLRRLRLDCR